MLKLSGSGGIIIDSLGLPDTNVQLTLEASLSAKYADAGSNRGCLAARLSKLLADTVGCEDFCRYDAGMHEHDVGYAVAFGSLFERNDSLLEGGAVKEEPLRACAASIVPCGSGGVGGDTGGGGGTGSGGGSRGIATFPAGAPLPLSFTPSSKQLNPGACRGLLCNRGEAACLPACPAVQSFPRQWKAAMPPPPTLAVVYTPPVQNNRGKTDCRLACSQQGLQAIDGGSSSLEVALCRSVGGIEQFLGGPGTANLHLCAQRRARGGATRGRGARLQPPAKRALRLVLVSIPSIVLLPHRHHDCGRARRRHVSHSRVSLHEFDWER